MIITSVRMKMGEELSRSVLPRQFKGKLSLAVNYKIIFADISATTYDILQYNIMTIMNTRALHVCTLKIIPEGLDDRNVQENVALHGEQEAFGVRSDLRGGYSASSSRRLRFPHGVDHAGLYRPERLQSHANRRSSGHQGVRNRHAYG